jgi:hypothetical protein
MIQRVAGLVEVVLLTQVVITVAKTTFPTRIPIGKSTKIRVGCLFSFRYLQEAYCRKKVTVFSFFNSYSLSIGLLQANVMRAL